MSTDDLVKLITEAIAHRWPPDGTSPGLTISLLRGGAYYCSVLRHNLPGTTGKTVVYNAEAITLQAALLAIAKRLVSEPKEKNPIDTLEDAIKQLEPIKNDHGMMDYLRKQMDKTKQTSKAWYEEEA